MVERRQRLAAGESLTVRIAVPVGHAVSVDELLERQSVALGTGVVLTEPHVGLAPSRPSAGRDDLGGLDRPRVLAGDTAPWHRPSSPASAMRSRRRSDCRRTERRQTRAGAWPTEHTGDRGVRLTVADRGSTGSAGIRRVVAHDAARLASANATIASYSSSVSGMTDSRFPLASNALSTSSGMPFSSSSEHELELAIRRDGHPVPSRVVRIGRRVEVLRRRIELRRVGLGALHDLADAGDAGWLRVRVVEDRTVTTSHLDA